MTGKSDKNLICLGVVGGTHGVRGAFRVKTFTEVETDIAAYGPLIVGDKGETIDLSVIRVVKPNLVLVKCDKISTPEDAALLNGQKLYVDRDELPSLDDEDEFYVEDLVGCEAVGADGSFAGVVAAIHNFGAGDLLELRNIPTVKGARYVRFTKADVPEIDLEANRLTLSEDAVTELLAADAAKEGKKKAADSSEPAAEN